MTKLQLFLLALSFCVPFSINFHCDSLSSLVGRSSKEALSLHLVQLLNEAEKQLDDTSSSAATSATASTNSPLRIDQDKHLALWKRRVRILRKMKSGLEQLSQFLSLSLIAKMLVWY